MDQTTLATIPRLISQVLAIYDVDAKAVFEKLNIDTSPEHTSTGRVHMEKMTSLWSAAVEATNDNELGLVAASLFQPSYLKGIGLAWMASANLEEGLRRFVKNSQLVNTSMQIELLDKDTELVIQYKTANNPSSKVRVHPCAIQLGIGFFLKMFRLAASKNIPATKVNFTFAINDTNNKYQDYFQCPVYGDSAHNSISFSKSLLNEMLPTHDPELVGFNEMAIDKYLLKMNTAETSSKVSKMITELLPTGCPSEEMIANRLFMSKRTMQRKLSNEQQSYSNLLNDVRFTLAKVYLSTKATSVTEIAYQLGYSSPSTFARAFKRAETISPLEYREAHQ